jgi:uncharacterized protein YjbJ (UPF0337 family)
MNDKLINGIANVLEKKAADFKTGDHPRAAANLAWKGVGEKSKPEPKAEKPDGGAPANNEEMRKAKIHMTKKIITIPTKPDGGAPACCKTAADNEYELTREVMFNMGKEAGLISGTKGALQSIGATFGKAKGALGQMKHVAKFGTPAQQKAMADSMGMRMYRGVKNAWGNVTGSRVRRLQGMTDDAIKQAKGIFKDPAQVAQIDEWLKGSGDIVGDMTSRQVTKLNRASKLLNTMPELLKQRQAARRVAGLVGGVGLGAAGLGAAGLAVPVGMYAHNKKQRQLAQGAPA